MRFTFNWLLILSKVSSYYSSWFLSCIRREWTFHFMHQEKKSDPGRSPLTTTNQYGNSSRVNAYTFQKQQSALYDIFRDRKEAKLGFTNTYVTNCYVEKYPTRNSTQSLPHLSLIRLNSSKLPQQKTVSGQLSSESAPDRLIRNQAIEKKVTHKRRCASQHLRERNTSEQIEQAYLFLNRPRYYKNYWLYN